MPEQTTDTLGAWLYQRFVPGADREAWARLSDDDRAYWEHQAAAVRRAVLRGGFKTEQAESTPLVVARFDVAMEHAPEEPPGLTVGAIAEDGRPVALVFDPESWAKVAGWLVPEAAHLRARIAELKTELARAQQPSYSQRHVWSVWQEEQPAHGFYGTVDDARQGSIDCWEEDEPHCPDYSWKPDGPRLELLVGGEASGVYISRHDVFGALAEPEKELTEARAELARYVGKEPTIAEEMAYLSRCFFAVHAVCDEAEQQARRWENPLPVPDWVATVRAAASGERPEDPNDNRRRIYLDAKSNAWISVSHEDGTEWVVPVQPAAFVEQDVRDVADETGGLREIGRCW